jgi:hypothetical protein
VRLEVPHPMVGRERDSIVDFASLLPNILGLISYYSLSQTTFCESGERIVILLEPHVPIIGRDRGSLLTRSPASSLVHYRVTSRSKLLFSASDIAPGNA